MGADPAVTDLPENAYRELAPGETYQPIVPAEAQLPEITRRSIAFGLAMTALFSAAAAFISLKLGQGIESAIPIAILAIGYSALVARKSSLLENVNIVTLGATAGIVVGGSTFTMPAIFILGLIDHSSFAQIFIVPLLGAVLGVLFLIPFRRYFVAQMHGKLPFPEATATTEILVTGARGGKQAVVLLYSMGIGMAVDFMALHFVAWRDTFTTVLIPSCRKLTDDLKAIFVLNTSAAVLGLGYIVGLRYATIICTGSFLSYYVFIPLFGHLGGMVPGPLFPGRPPIPGLAAEDIFKQYVRYIGIGAIFAAGVLSVLKMSPIIVQAIRQVFGEISRARQGAASGAVRTDRDLSIRSVVLGTIAVGTLLFLYFRFFVLPDQAAPTATSFAALALTLVITFLFAAVSAWAIAMISTTPISGMTLTTLIISAIVLSAMKLAGASGMIAVLLIGGVVCTALSMTGSMVTLLKVGYWTGATPRRIELTLIGGSVVAALTVTAMMFVFNKVYGFGEPTAIHPHPVAAPQATAMAAVIGSVMQSGQAPWFLYGIGAVVSVIMQSLGISALAFALGMYLPIELNTPILAGAVVAWLVKRGPTPALLRARGNRGTLIASGFIAGGALAGVFDGIIRLIVDLFHGEVTWSLGNDGPAGNWLGLAVFVALGGYLYWDARRATEAEGAGPEISL
ncbi:MAG TPA: oligopeptide transporter, OPT family [Candidatus Polarisedimenticolaceae bacterium]|nr:oligopeptide transporter, OPT family [Candidatus Polarisedimenticolaceae bacterium]